MRRLGAVLCCLAASVALADDLPEGLRTDRDLRGVYRAALCERADMTAAECARDLRTYAGETPAPKPPPSDPARWRLVFIPGFLADCFPSIHSFADVIKAAKERGYAAEILKAGGRDGVLESVERLWPQFSEIPDDGRKIVLIGHSKGAAEALQLLLAKPQIKSRVVAVLTVTGALQGSTVADTFAPFEEVLRLLPAGRCGPGEGRPVRDLTTAKRADWWKQNGSAFDTPLYSIVALPDLHLLSAIMLMPYAISSFSSSDNDGLLLARHQVGPGGHLLGVVNADHLTAGVPFPGPMFVFTFRDVPFKRAQVILAAIDVIAARTPER